VRKTLKFPQPVTGFTYPALSWDQEHPFCPWIHPKFVKGTSCFAYTHILSGNIHKQTTYGSPKLMNFLKTHYRGIAYIKLKYSG